MIEKHQIFKHFSTYVIIEYKNSLILVSIIPTNSILTSPVHWISLLANGATINPLSAVIELAIPINQLSVLRHINKYNSNLHVLLMFISYI